MNDLENVMDFEGNDVIILSIDDKPHFELFSVGKALGYVVTGKNKNNPLPNKSRIIRTLENADIQGCLHGANTYLSETELYDFMFEAHTRKCKKFKKWLSTSVLPQIRQTGGYIPIEENDTEELIMAKGLLIANETIKKKDDIIAQKNKLLEKQKPIVDNYKILMDTKGTFSMNEVAHFVGVGEYYLFKFLRDIGIFFYNATQDNVPYENTVNKTKFKVVPAIAPDGSAHSVTRILPSGIDYICKQLKKYGYLEVA